MEPSNEQKALPDHEKRGKLRIVASPGGRDNSVRANQDALMLSGLSDGHEKAVYSLAPGRLGYVPIVRGEVAVIDYRSERTMP